MRRLKNKHTVSVRRRNQEAGFTIMETAIALVLMAIVGLGAASLFFYATRSMVSEGDRQLAMAVAQEQIEQLRNVDFNDPSLVATTGTQTTLTRAGRQYLVTTVIRDGDVINAAPTTKTIQIQVRPIMNELTTVNSLFGSVSLETRRTALTVGPNRQI